MKESPVIKVEFLLTKKDEFDFDRDEVSRLLNILPSMTSPPRLSQGVVYCDDERNNDTFSGLTMVKTSEKTYSLIINAFWSKEIVVEEGALEDAVCKLKEKLFDKEKLITEICRNNSLFVSIVFRIYVTNENLPEMSFSRESINYFNLLEACIDIDLQLQ